MKAVNHTNFKCTGCPLAQDVARFWVSVPPASTLPPRDRDSGLQAGAGVRKTGEAAPPGCTPARLCGLRLLSGFGLF